MPTTAITHSTRNTVEYLRNPYKRNIIELKAMVETLRNTADTPKGSDIWTEATDTTKTRTEETAT